MTAEIVERSRRPLPANMKKFLFMKVGNHAGQTFEQILARKREERRRAGMIFWGYGGSACHPISQVRPFIKLMQEQKQVPYLLMQSIKSNSDQEQYPAEEYSEDGIVWKPIPKGIVCTGSRYAMILDEIEEGDFILDVREYEVGVGPSRGKSASAYLQGRTDKACLDRLPSAPVGIPEEAQLKSIDFVAKLKDPFAVLLR